MKVCSSYTVELVFSSLFNNTHLFRGFCKRCKISLFRWEHLERLHINIFTRTFIYFNQRSMFDQNTKTLKIAQTYCFIEFPLNKHIDFKVGWHQKIPPYITRILVTHICVMRSLSTVRQKLYRQSSKRFETHKSPNFLPLGNFNLSEIKVVVSKCLKFNILWKFTSML